MERHRSLYKLFDSEKMNHCIFEHLLSKNECLEPENGKKVVTKKELIKSVYDAIFVDDYSGKYYCKTIGEYSSEESSKDFAISVASAFYRKQRGWSQEILAEKICVSTRTVQNLECGKYLPGLELLLEISKVFNASVDDLLEIKNPPATRRKEMISNRTAEERKKSISILTEVAGLLLKY